MRGQVARRSAAARVSSRLFLGVAASMLAQPISRAQPPGPDEHEAWRSSFSTLSREIFARLDEAERTARSRYAQLIAIERVKADRDMAGKDVELAEIGVAEYLKGAYPQDLASAHDSIEVAQRSLTREKEHLRLAEAALKRDPDSFYVQSQQLYIRTYLENAEIELKNARRKLLTLEEYTKARQVADLQAAVDKAKADRRSKEEVVVKATEVLADLKRQAALAAPLDEEKRAVALLDEAIQVEALWRVALDGGKDGEAKAVEGKDSLAAKAKAKLAAAAKAWDEAKAKRAELQEADAKARIHRAAESIGGRGADRH